MKNKKRIRPSRPPGSSPVLMKDIAKHLGISRASVSYVLNQSRQMDSMSQTTIERIQKAAKELGYRPNEIARAMKTGKTRTIGFITHPLQWESNVMVMHGATEQAFTSGYTIKYIPTNEQNDNPEQIAQHCIDQKLAGIICMNIDYPFLKKMYSILGATHLPLAQVVNGFSELGHIIITADDTMGTQKMIEHLAGLGHKKIAMMTNSKEQPSSAARIASFKAAMQAQGLSVPKSYIREGHFDPDKIARETRELLRLKNPPTAVFCDNDPTAMSVINTLRRKGIKVPEEISVGGYVNLSVGRFFDPPLTTVSHPFSELGATTARELILEIETRTPAQRTITISLPTHLVERASTAPVHS